MINTGIEVILSAFISAFIAQFVKLITHLIRRGRIDFSIIARTGGMPSSHSSGVVALTTSVGIITGFKSVEFAIALGYALIVMYDAAGLRRSAGKMAKVLNDLVEDIYEHRPAHAGGKLAELLGHTPLEVLMGAILGCATAFALHHFLLM